MYIIMYNYKHVILLGNVSSYDSIHDCVIIIQDTGEYKGSIHSRRCVYRGLNIIISNAHIIHTHPTTSS